MIRQLILALILLFIIGCTPQTIIVTKYQCQNGQVADSIELCEEQICPKKVCEKVKEPYVETVSYTYTLNYGIISDVTSGDFEINTEGIPNYITEQTTKIKNFDDKKGYFTVKHHYRTLNKEGTKEISHEVDSDETKDFVTTFDTALFEDVEVKTEIIPVTETRYKEEIKYKDVEICSCE